MSIPVKPNAQLGHLLLELVLDVPHVHVLVPLHDNYKVCGSFIDHFRIVIASILYVYHVPQQLEHVGPLSGSLHFLAAFNIPSLRKYSKTVCIITE